MADGERLDLTNIPLSIEDMDLSPDTVEWAGEGVAPWRRQPWDTEASYARFRRYYLSQEPPRSLLAAYRQYLIGRGRDPETVQSRTVRVPGTWVDWSTRGDMNWQQRADAWDRYREQILFREMARQQEAIAREYARRRRELLEREYRIGMAMLDRVEQMMQAQLFQQRNQGGTTIIEPSDWTEADISRHAKTASELVRNAVGLPRQTVAVEDWRSQLASLGLDPEVVFEQVVRAIVASDESGVDGADPGGDGESPATGRP